MGGQKDSVMPLHMTKEEYGLFVFDEPPPFHLFLALNFMLQLLSVSVETPESNEDEELFGPEAMR